MTEEEKQFLTPPVLKFTRSLSMPDTSEDIPPPPPKRAPTTALSMRSKSMTSELEEMGKTRHKDGEISQKRGEGEREERGKERPRGWR